MKHTPGPWILDDRIHADGKIDVIPVNACKGEYTVARVFCYGENCFMNAHLISAAPEMLDALEMAYNNLKSRGPTDGPHAPAEHAAMLYHLSEIISKARGEQ